MALQKDATTEIHRWNKVVADAALTFERRWTDLALRRVDGALARLLHEQLGMFHKACLDGSADDIGTHGSAMCRGYAAAIRAMEAAGAPDDSYQLGSDPITGTKVAVGAHKGVLERVQELHGQDVICITPDEVAVMIGAAGALQGVGAIKKLFPGAEIIRKYAEEGT